MHNSDDTQFGPIRQDLPPGALLKSGQYRIESVLGQGGFGITYLAEQTGLGRKVAIKEFFPRDFCNRLGGSTTVSVASISNSATFDQLKGRFIKEARNIASLNHPNIIRILETFEENGTAYYVTDYIEGLSLRDTIKRFGPVPVPEAKRYIEIIGRAVDYIHQRRMNHLDIKPANIMIRYTDNQPILIDFGTSKQYDASGDQTSSTMVGLTHGYAPIEQYHPGGVANFSPQTDIYSLGATLYTMLTAKVPPHCSDIEGPQSLPLPPAVPQNVARAVHYAMQLHRNNRPDSVDRFLTLLGPVAGKSAQGQPTAAPRERRGGTNPLLIGLLVAILIAIVVFIVLVYKGREPVVSGFPEVPAQETTSEYSPAEAEAPAAAESPAEAARPTSSAPMGSAEREVLSAPSGSLNGRRAHFYIGNTYYKSDYGDRSNQDIKIGFYEDTDGRIDGALLYNMTTGERIPMSVNMSGSQVDLWSPDGGFTVSLSSAQEADRLIGEAMDGGRRHVVRLMPTTKKFS